MRFTNEHNLPAPLFKAICNDSYDVGESDISVTALIAPARIRQLKIRNADKLTEDASERIWSLIGQIGHSIIERAADSGMVEKRLYIEREGLKIGGQIDWIEDERKITDYKFASYHTAKDGAKPEWIAQLNIYRLICKENGIDINGLQVVCIFRDWSKLAAARQADYPQAQVAVMDLPLWPYEKTEAYLAERIRAHQDAEKILPECTDEERWMRAEKWAVMAKGKKRAVKLHETEQEATSHAANVGGRVEHRPGENVRCLHYCPVLAFCSQGRELIQDAN